MVYENVRWECPAKSGGIGMSWDAFWKARVTVQMWRLMEGRCVWNCRETNLLLRVNLSTTREVAWYIISVVSVCQTITFDSLDLVSSYLQIRYISRECGSSSYMKVVGSRSRSQEQKSRKFLFSQCKTSIGNNFGSIKHRAIKFACIMRFSTVVDWLVWPPFLSRDRKWPRVTK